MKITSELSLPATGTAISAAAPVLITAAACYWDSNLSSGTGSNNGRDDTHKVDGIDVTWQTAVAAMNTALQSAGSGWHYELTGELPTLKKQ